MKKLSQKKRDSKKRRENKRHQRRLNGVKRRKYSNAGVPWKGKNQVKK